MKLPILRPSWRDFDPFLFSLVMLLAVLGIFFISSADGAGTGGSLLRSLAFKQGHLPVPKHTAQRSTGFCVGGVRIQFKVTPETFHQGQRADSACDKHATGHHVIPGAFNRLEQPVIPFFPADHCGSGLEVGESHGMAFRNHLAMNRPMLLKEPARQVIDQQSQADKAGHLGFRIARQPERPIF